LLGDVFDVFPAGILVVTDAKRALAWNPAAAELLGDDLAHTTTCCEVFGCRTPGTALANCCMTELSLARGVRWTTVIDVSRRPGTGIAVTATPFTRAAGRTVVYEIRAANETSSPATAPSGDVSIRIRTLGETVVESPAGEVRGDWLDQRAGRLLKLLVTHRYTPLHADTIAEVLWPKARTDTTNTVRHFVHTLRAKLEPQRGRYARSNFVLARNGGYLLNPNCVEVDADLFEREVEAALVAVAANERVAAAGRLTRAVELYRGDFLADERFEDWAIAERERLRDLAARSLRLLAELSGDPALEVGYLERLAEMEPLDVDVHRDLIECWFRQGRRGRAIRHYRALQSRLMRELGERVTFDLTELAHLR
jgi:DNA-binding SARP family transcriptional activator